MLIDAILVIQYYLVIVCSSIVSDFNQL